MRGDPPAGGLRLQKRLRPERGREIERKGSKCLEARKEGRNRKGKEGEGSKEGRKGRERKEKEGRRRKEGEGRKGRNRKEKEGEGRKRKEKEGEGRKRAIDKICALGRWHDCQLQRLSRLWIVELRGAGRNRMDESG